MGIQNWKVWATLMISVEHAVFAAADLGCESFVEREGRLGSGLRVDILERIFQSLFLQVGPF